MKFLFGDEAGAGEHTHAGGLGRAHQTMFDWLDVTLAVSSASTSTQPSE